jgi:hypothetical protein
LPAACPCRLHFEIPGWRGIQEGRDMALWQDIDGDYLGLVRTQAGLGLPKLCDEDAVRRHCRKIAESMESGLIEADVIEHAEGTAVRFISKRLKMPAFAFTGVLMVPTLRTSWVWTTSAQERGGTGVREAVITAQLLSGGEITLESYPTSWAGDPYDPAYDGVDRRTLRYLSDDERYDARFPDHPLSKVRRELRKLLTVRLGG